MVASLLLAVHCKRADPVDLKDAVMEYVANTYGKRAAEDCADDLAEVESLRALIINQPKATSILRETLTKYYRILCAMESRFPVSDAHGHVNITFSWYDAFHSTKRTDQANIHFEKAAVAFNVAAAISQYALDCDRRSDVGLASAIRLFQEAAGAFGHLRDHVALKVESPRPIDLTPECAAMLERLMLAQAQECVLEKASAGGKQPATLARLAKQVAVFYDDTYRLLSSKPLSDHFDKSWLSHASAKSLLFHLEADLQNAAHLRTEDFLKGVASEIAQLKAAKTPLEAAKKEAKSASKELQENVAEKEQYVTERLAKAERENASVYLQRIPSAADLPGVVPACLVKATSPTDMVSTSASEQLFKGVVPETTTRALSKYTDMLDSLIRKQTDALDSASDDARIKLREWELPESLNALEPNGGSMASLLPEALKIDLEKVESAGGLPHLQDLVKQIQSLRLVTATELDAAEADLAAEAREDEELRLHYGARWRRPPSSQLNAQMTDKLKGYRSNLNAAGESDAQLETKIKAEAGAFGALDPAAASLGMPRLQSPMLSVENMEPAAAVSALRAGLEGLATLSSQRAALEQALKERKAGDDILPKLLGGTSDMDALFQSELSKYDDLIKGVEENVTKQRQLVEAVGAANRTFRETYNFAEWKRECDAAAQSIRATAKSFTEVSGNLSEGVRFYTSLQDAVAALRQQIGDFVMTRKVQRDDLLDELKKAAAVQEAAAVQHMAGMNLQSQYSAGSSAGYPATGGQAPPPPPHQPQQGYAPPAPYHQLQQQQQPVPQWPPPIYAQQQQHYPGGPAVWPPQQQQLQQPTPYGVPQPSYPQPQYQAGPVYQSGQPQYAQQQPPPPPPPQQQQGNPIGNFFGFGK